MKTATLSLIDLYRRCLTKAIALGDGHAEARNRLYEAAEHFRAEHDVLYGVDDAEGPVGCREDESWL